MKTCTAETVPLTKCCANIRTRNLVFEDNSFDASSGKYARVAGGTSDKNKLQICNPVYSHS
jgi:hypothetical protein